MKYRNNSFKMPSFEKLYFVGSVIGCKVFRKSIIPILKEELFLSLVN